MNSHCGLIGRVGETTVRRAVSGDAEGIARVHTTTWQIAYRGVVPDEFLAGLSPQRRAEGWRRALAEPSVARDEDLRRQGVLELHAIYVHPSGWGSGIGRALLDASFAHRTGVGVMLWVLEDNPRARRFYERAGFAPDGVPRTETIGGRELVELRYVSSPRHTSMTSTGRIPTDS